MSSLLWLIRSRAGDDGKRDEWGCCRWFSNEHLCIILSSWHWVGTFSFAGEINAGLLCGMALPLHEFVC